MNKFELDPAGAPLIWVSALNGYLHYLPVLRPQFEYFLCDQPSTTFDQTRYEAMLDIHLPRKPDGTAEPRKKPRTRPAMVKDSDYYEALLTGIHPSEAEAYLAWHNLQGAGEYDLPSDKQWKDAFAELNKKPRLNVKAAFSDLELKPRFRALIERLDGLAAQLVARQERREPTLAEQMLLRNGLMEWVRYNDSKRLCPDYGGRGCPAEASLFSAIKDYTTTPQPHDPGKNFDNEKERVTIRAYGLRLFRKD